MGFLDGIQNMLKSKTGTDTYLNQLKGMLSEKDFDAVKQAIDRIVVKNYEDMKRVQDTALNDARKHQKEVNALTNKVRDLEVQLILAASEVTDLEELLSRAAQAQNGTAIPMPPVITTGGEDHPVFGKFLADFGYKQIYAADPGKLYAATPIYKKQRILRTERASAIARVKKQSKVTGWPGTISVVEFPTDEGRTQAVLVDGQHRLGAFTLLQRQLKSQGQDPTQIAGMSEILVELYPTVEGEDMAAEIFTEINKAEPCKLLDLPQSKVSQMEKQIINGAAEKLRSKFSAMFKPSSACRTPHMNIDNLRDELFQAKVVTRYGFEDDDQLFQWLLDKNNALGKIPKDMWVPRRRTRAKTLGRALDKAEIQGFYLGLEWDWLDDNVMAAPPVGDDEDWSEDSEDMDGDDK